MLLLNIKKCMIAVLFTAIQAFVNLIAARNSLTISLLHLIINPKHFLTETNGVLDF